jgi:hypothetical protein
MIAKPGKVKVTLTYKDCVKEGEFKVRSTLVLRFSRTVGRFWVHTDTSMYFVTPRKKNGKVRWVGEDARGEYAYEPSLDVDDELNTSIRFFSQSIVNLLEELLTDQPSWQSIHSLVCNWDKQKMETLR